MEGDKVVKLSDALTISEFKLGAPKLYDVIRSEVLRDEKSRRTEIGAAIKLTQLPADAQARLMVACIELPIADAQKLIDREEKVEVALAGGKMAGLDDKDIEILRKDIADLPMGTAVRLVQQTVDAKKGIAARLVNGADPVTNTPAADAKIADAVKLARAEFPEVVKGVPNANEAHYIEQCLMDAKLKYTPADLKAAAPDLFK